MGRKSDNEDDQNSNNEDDQNSNKEGDQNGDNEGDINSYNEGDRNSSKRLKRLHDSSFSSTDSSSETEIIRKFVKVANPISPFNIDESNSWRRSSTHEGSKMIKSENEDNDFQDGLSLHEDSLDMIEVELGESSFLKEGTEKSNKNRGKLILRTRGIVIEITRGSVIEKTRGRVKGRTRGN